MSQNQAMKLAGIPNGDPVGPTMPFLKEKSRTGPIPTLHHTCNHRTSGSACSHSPRSSSPGLESGSPSSSSSFIALHLAGVQQESALPEGVSVARNASSNNTPPATPRQGSLPSSPRTPRLTSRASMSNIDLISPCPACARLGLTQDIKDLDKLSKPTRSLEEHHSTGPNFNQQGAGPTLVRSRKITSFTGKLAHSPSMSGCDWKCLLKTRVKGKADGSESSTTESTSSTTDEAVSTPTSSRVSMTF